MLLTDVPNGFWSDDRYNKTTVTFDAATDEIHISDALGAPICGSGDVVPIVGKERDVDPLCLECAVIVIDWVNQ